MEIVPIRPDQAEEARILIYSVAREIFDPGLTLEECLRDYAGELADLEKIESYYFDGGTFLVMMDGEKMMGTGAIHCLDDETCELKRLWFLPEVQGKGLGWQMIQRLREEARMRGYRRMWLQTDPVKQVRAMRLYERLGFTRIPDYRESPGDISMELVLSE